MLDRAERDRRRVGPQPAALAARRRVARAGLLLRQDGLRRDVPVRARASPATTARPPARTLDAPEIAARAADGDAAAARRARALRGAAGARAGRVINVLDPDVIVLGGGMSNIARLYESVPRLWGEWVFSDRVDTAARPPGHGDSSGVRGAAWLWGPGEA